MLTKHSFAISNPLEVIMADDVTVDDLNKARSGGWEEYQALCKKAPRSVEIDHHEAVADEEEPDRQPVDTEPFF